MSNKCESQKFKIKAAGASDYARAARSAVQVPRRILVLEVGPPTETLAAVPSSCWSLFLSSTRAAIRASCLDVDMSPSCSRGLSG